MDQRGSGGGGDEKARTILEVTNGFVQDHFVQDPFMHNIGKQTEDQRVALLLL